MAPHAELNTSSQTTTTTITEHQCEQSREFEDLFDNKMCNIRRRRLSYPGEKLMMKMFSEAGHVEHAMMNMLHNAWNVLLCPGDAGVCFF